MSTVRWTVFLVIVAVVVVLPLAAGGLALGIGWVEAFGEAWGAWTMLLLVCAAAWWAHRRGRRLLPVASAPSLRRAVGQLERVWSLQLIAVGVYGVAAQWWIRRTLLSGAERWVFLPWSRSLLLMAGLALLLAGWAYGPRWLRLERVRHHDLAVQRRRIHAGAVAVWSCFEAAGLLGVVVACGTVSLLPFDLLGGGAVASLLAHRVWWFERLVDLVMHPPLAEPAHAPAAPGLAA